MAASVHLSTDMARPIISSHSPDIFAVICCNDSFQLTLDLSTIKILLQVCKRVQPLLSSKVTRFHTWCQISGLCHPDGSLRIGLTPSDQIALSLHCKDPVTADRSWLVGLVDRDNAPASYLLARTIQLDLNRWRYLLEFERADQQEDIFHLFDAAANANHAMAQFHLAGCHLHGHGVTQDHIKAVEMYRSLADRGMPQAQVALGRCFDNGEGVDQDFTTAIEWYSKAANQGSDDGRLHIAFLRGWFSFMGHGVEQSDADALRYWLEVNTNSRDLVHKSVATHMVGWMHYLGRGTVRDEQKGIKVIRDNQSDEFPFGDKECLSGWYLAPCSSPASRKYFELCQLGSEQSWLCKHLMAVCLFDGFGTAQDQPRAAYIFKQLATDDHTDSQFWTGMCYYWGQGVADDNDAAVEWFRMSAEQGNQYGQNYLGLCYYYGRGVTKSIDTAVFWYQKSASQGNQEAINKLKIIGKWS